MEIQADLGVKQLAFAENAQPSRFQNALNLDKKNTMECGTS